MNAETSRVTFIDYQKPLWKKLGESLIAKGYALASESGVPLDSLGNLYPPTLNGGFGILWNDPRDKPFKLFGLLEFKPKRKFLGIIWFDNSKHKAEARNWVFEAYGAMHGMLFMELSEELANELDVNIKVRLMCLDEVLESKDEDG